MKQMFTLAAAAAAVSLLAGCNGEKPAEQKAAPAAEAAAVIIYSNADEEAQKAMKNALDANGMKGLYKIQGLGTSELGGKLAAEGKNIEADVVTTASPLSWTVSKRQPETFPEACVHAGHDQSDTGLLCADPRQLRSALHQYSGARCGQNKAASSHPHSGSCSAHLCRSYFRAGHSGFFHIVADDAGCHCR